MMTLVRRHPWQEMDLMRRQIDRMVADLTAQPEATWTPAVELKSNETEFVLRAQLPGMTAQDVTVEVGQRAIALSGERSFENQTEDQGYFRSEFRYGKFQRVIALPAPVQNDRVTAEFKDGILTLTLPKVQAVRPTVVKVNLAETAPAAETAPETAPTIVPETEDVWTQG